MTRKLDWVSRRKIPSGKANARLNTLPMLPLTSYRWQLESSLVK